MLINEKESKLKPLTHFLSHAIMSDEDCEVLAQPARLSGLTLTYEAGGHSSIPAQGT